MPRTGGRSTLPLPVEQSALPPCTAHTHSADSFGHSARILGRYTTVHPASAMGRLDQSRGYHFDRRILRCHMRDAKNAG